MAGHRYWQIVGVTVPGDYLQISELQLLAGAVVVSAGITPTASNAPISHTLADLVDGQLAVDQVTWRPEVAQDPGFYIRFDLGVERAVDGVRQAGGDTANRYMSAFTLQYADNPSGPWSDYGSLTGLAYPGNYALSEIYRFGRDVFRHWRIYVTAVDGSTSYASFGEIEIKADAGGADLTTGLGASASQSGDSAVGTASAAVDNNTGSECGSSFPLPWWWAIDLGSAQEVTVCTLRAQRSVPNRTPKDFEIQGSADGSSWLTVAAYTGVSGWAEYEQRVFTFRDQYEVRGELRVSGVLLTSPRRVRVHRVSDGALLGQADTVDGLFAINIGYTQEECYVVPIDLGASPSDWAPPCARVMSSLIVV